ncbi:MAG TPA: hypothetical protein VLX09_25920 [Stellaceae bacterium]|nr:hypothetical protein [Stellaceae bacterium]
MNRLYADGFSIAVLLGLLLLCGSILDTARAEREDVFLTMVGLALTGNDRNIVHVVDRSNCIFSLSHRGSYGERDIEVFHLNNIDVDRLTIQVFGTREGRRNIVKYLKVPLHGDAVVYEDTILVQPKFGAQLNFPNLDGEASNQHVLTLYTNKTDKVAQAWSYIYKNGCRGKRGSL